MSNTNKMIGHFEDKPATQLFYKQIDDVVFHLPGVKKEVHAQASYAVKRKFLWMWAYEQTPDGTLYLTVLLDEKWDHPQLHSITQISANRWNHHVVIKNVETAQSELLKELLQKGYLFAKK